MSRLETDWVERFDLPVRIAAQLAVEPTEVLKRVEARRLDRSEQVAVVAAREAWAHAGLAGDEPKVDPLRLAVIIGTGIGGALTLLGQDDLLETQGLAASLQSRSAPVAILTDCPPQRLLAPSVGSSRSPRDGDAARR